MRFMRFKCLCNPGLFAFICAGIVMLCCGGCAAGFRVENDEMDEEIVEAYSVLTKIEDGASAIEKGYLDNDGFVDPEQMDGLLEEINEYAASLYEEGVITDYRYQSGDTCVYIEVDGWLGCLYDPPLDGVLSGGAEKPQIVTLESVHAPLMFALAGFRGPDDTARMIEEKDPSFTFSANYDKGDVTIETIQNLPQNSVIIWAGHGAYNSEFGSALCLGGMSDSSTKGPSANYQSMMLLHREELQDKAVLSTMNGGFCVTSKFFEQYMPKNALYGDVVYLGACSSYYCATYEGYEDSRLVDSILGLGASVVLGNTYVVSPIYSYKMTDSFFEGLAEPMDDGALRTVEEALAYAKEKNGKEDAINKSEVFAKCAEGKEDFRLSDMPQNAQVEDADQTYSECTVQGYYPGGWDCPITFSEAMIEERDVMVREYGSGAGSDGQPLAGYEESSVTFISLAPGSRVTVPPNTHDTPYYGEDEYYDPGDPYYSQAICEGAGSIIDGNHYELEWSGSVDGFSSGTAEEIIRWDDYFLMLSTDQFDTDYCFIVMDQGDPDLSQLDNRSSSDNVVDFGECGAQGDNLIWTLDDQGTLTIGGAGEMEDYAPLTAINPTSDFKPWWNYTNDIREVRIGSGVTSIGESAFGGTNLENITIPENVTDIGCYAFEYCTSLKNVTLSKGVTSIELASFFDCTSLESITLTDSVIRIGYSAFDYCTELTDVYYSGTKEQWEAIDILENNDPLLNATIHFDGVEPRDPTENKCGDDLTWKLEDGVLTISGTGEMWGLEYMDTEEVPWHEDKTAIKKVVLENGVTTVGKWAFCDCTNLTSVTIPDSVTSIGESVFIDCNQLKSAGPIGKDYDIEFGWTSEIPAHAFSECSSLASVTIPNSVTRVGLFAFSDCSSLTSVTILDGVTSIGAGAFFKCSSLASVTIPSSVTRIEDGAFCDCSSLADVYYSGSRDDWAKIYIMSSNITSGNTALTNATIHYNSTKP